MGLVEKHGEWLGSSIGPHTKRSMDRNVRLVVQHDLDLLWVKQHTSAECKNVTCYSTFQEGTTNVAGKEAPQSPSTYDS